MMVSIKVNLHPDGSITSDMDKGQEENGIALQKITSKADSANSHANPIFSMETESDSGPPPYIGPSDGGENSRSGDIPGGGHLDDKGYQKRATSPSNISINGDIQKLDSLLAVDGTNVETRKRHKSDGAVPNTPVGKTFLDPNNKKSSMYESKSTISGVKFDDSFIDESGTTLIYSRHEKVPLKDFTMEVRAHMDIKKFLNNTVLLLDLTQVSLDAIIDEILHKLLDTAESKVAFDQARSALFTHDNVHQLTRTLQCTSISEGGGFDYDQSWICAIASVPSISRRHVGIAKLKHPANFGPSSQEVYFVILILTPTKEKSTKNDLETGRTFSTIFSDPDHRTQLLDCHTEEEFKKVLADNTNAMMERMHHVDEKVPTFDNEKEKKCCRFMTGVVGDLKRRIPHYWSDYKDGVVGPKSIQKTLSTTFFLYFACLMPSIAFGVLNSENTYGSLNVEKVLYSQTIGGLAFALFGGTPQIVLLTTAPLALYTKIIYSICEDFDLDFEAMFCCVGLWNTFFLFLYSAFDLSEVMKWSTRSSEEIFALFISIAFTIDAIKNTVQNFDVHYSIPECANDFNSTKVAVENALNNVTAEVRPCERDVSLLYLLLLLGTLWLGVTLYNFTKTPYLNPGKRELLADYSLPVAVVIISLIGVFAFDDVNMGKGFDSARGNNIFTVVPLHKLSVGAVFGGMGLGFCLSLLFFMDQNISAALVNAPQNKMKKGTAYHWDLLVIGLVNGVLSIFGFPWVHAALPHSPLHVRALADVEERVDQGHIYSIIVKVRETRLTAIFSHILIGLSLLILPVLSYIPTPVLYGLFLYIAVTALTGNQMFERIMLLITEQSAYPPNHYIRRVPQRMMHFFTLLQLIQLAVLCVFGFTPYPYLKMFFPILIFILIPLRQKIIPKIIQQKYLNAMDGH
ncbi:solute carrier family 4 member 11-like isoform X2 [Mercenaria mercenaria]|uniref:solute carrier family 4 member 11-like isoform X2 n=1 Tax=Mercenaria mercenaria TaxID=6596 RepID=UPI00234F2607|nr:solute carrier family 4 member 11-like isoform X2 [Mercenaria mercenaria]